jgi:catechol 2,3-dioxygenase-like lactoylglutathione lyase family enzyme
MWLNGIRSVRSGLRRAKKEDTMLTGIHHVGIICDDIERSKRFYTEVVGGKLLYDAGTSPPGHLDGRVKVPGAIAKKAVVKVGKATLELVEYVTPKIKPQGLSAAGIGTLHLALEVDDIDAEVERLKTKGVEFNSPPTVIEDGPDKGWVWCYFNGPDGCQLELVENRNLKVPL